MLRLCEDKQTRSGENVTEQNPMVDIEDQKTLSRLQSGQCPDCAGKLRGGPRGGSSQNAMCESCHEEFNLMWPFGVERMGKTPERAKAIYGL
jgi:hypothetical protein